MPQVPAVSGAIDLVSFTDRAFADDGPLTRALPNFEPRDGQRRMARAVATTLHEGGILLAEAGTGTGKTLAYLVPAVLSRERVLISTATKSLQEQLLFNDLPMLQGALNVPFTATCMKGRSNYLCLHRFEQLQTGTTHESQRLSDWAATTETGDRAELLDLPDDAALWAEVAATAETCLGGDCPRFDDCFVTRMRQRAAESDLVIVNHHLLCADAALRHSSFGEVIPTTRHIILDEAHQLEDVATQHFGIAVSNYRIDDLARDADRMLGVGLIEDRSSRVGRAVARLAEVARTFFGQIALARRMRGPSADERLRITAEWFGEIATEGVDLLAAFEAFEASVLLASGASTAHSGTEREEDVAALVRRARELREQLHVLLAASDPAFVYFVEMRGRGVFLRAAPVDVADIVRTQLLGKKRTAVLTSATLSVQGSFDYVRGRLGVDEADELQVPSEFDHATQALLYLPRSMPSPKAPHYSEAVAAEVVGIVRRTKGRAFVLFTSHAAMRSVHAMASPAIPYPSLLQGTAPPGALLSQFRSTPHAVLFATSSFWQGVDVAGEGLSCVIVDKLPFASPADPVTAARVEAIADAGGSPFDEYQVPVAILTLRQGLGRLLRHRTDRGVLAVLDPRLRTMSYGRRFLESLPPARLTFDLRDIERFFAVGSS